MWFSDHVKKFLESHINNSNFNKINIRKIWDRELTGKAFFHLTKEKLTRKDGFYKLNPSSTEGIIELIEELNKNLDN